MQELEKLRQNLIDDITADDNFNNAFNDEAFTRLFNEFIGDGNPSPIDTSSHLIDPARVYPKPPALLEQVKENGQTATFGVLGSVNLIKGRAKSRKTGLVAMMCAQLLQTDTRSQIMPSFQRGSAYDPSRPVIVIDTEQSDYDCSQVAHLPYRINGDTFGQYGQRLQYYSLLGESRDYKVNFIWKIMKDKKPQALFIDNVPDLMPDMNDQASTGQLTEFLLGLAKAGNCAIFGVVHMNQSGGTTKAMGAIGSAFERKCRDCFSVTKDGGTGESIVSFEGCRGVEGDPFKFTYTDDFLPKSSGSEVTKPANYGRAIYNSFGDEEFTREEGEKAIIEASNIAEYNPSGKPVGTRRAAEILKDMQAETDTRKPLVVVFKGSSSTGRAAFTYKLTSFALDYFKYENGPASI